VYQYLSDRGGTEILKDPELIQATQCVVSSSRSEIQEAVTEKQKARENLVKRYTSDKLSSEQLVRCIDSLADSNSYILANRHPVDRMIKFLHKYFDPKKPESDEFSLAISRGKGSCLTHSHSTQFKFVNQSLQLWREIQHEMFRLWIHADADLISGGYNLTNTGQGLNRLQSAPHVSSLMSKILSRVKSRVGDWVGLSVVHLADRDVPNALFFIDKYNQVPRILSPIVQTIDGLDFLLDRPGMGDLVKQLVGRGVGEKNGIEAIKKKILCDFFRFGFDGSGDDGGSCIDGRLTSAWNWCSKIERKDFYSIFLLTGFQGFDGSFRK